MIYSWGEKLYGSVLPAGSEPGQYFPTFLGGATIKEIGGSEWKVYILLSDGQVFSCLISLPPSIPTSAFRTVAMTPNSWADNPIKHLSVGSQRILATDAFGGVWTWFHIKDYEEGDIPFTENVYGYGDFKILAQGMGIQIEDFKPQPIVVKNDGQITAIFSYIHQIIAVEAPVVNVGSLYVNNSCDQNSFYCPSMA
eukprot:130282_1